MFNGAEGDRHACLRAARLSAAYVAPNAPPAMTGSHTGDAAATPDTCTTDAKMKPETATRPTGL